MSDVLKNPGKVQCLGSCNMMFDSIDKATNRICSSCQKKLNKERKQRVVSSRFQHDGRMLQMDGDD